MLSYNDIVDLIKKSNISLIGYSFKNEKEKDELISNFDYFEIGEIDSSFSIKSVLRDFKLSSTLDICDTKLPEFFLINLNDIKYNSEGSIQRVNQINNFLDKIQSEMFRGLTSSFPSNPPFQLIIIAPVNRNVWDANATARQISSGKPIYIADIAVSISDDKIKVIKNRFGQDGDEICCKFVKDYETSY